ncbi:UNVERIFIED_CONTAM: hypothetical protein FKN15_006944 [Acipenser sinensis]
MEKMARPISVTPTFLPPTHGVLKSLLENPVKLSVHHEEGFGKKEKEKEKEEKLDDDGSGSNVPQSAFLGFGKEKEKEKEEKLDDDGSGSNVPQSAFLGPTLWDKTLPYDGDCFQLEYMDLEEFLLENGIPSSPSQHNQHQHQQPALPLAPAPPPTPSVMDLSNQASTSVHQAMSNQNCMHSPGRAGNQPSFQTPAAKHELK